MHERGRGTAWRREQARAEEVSGRRVLSVGGCRVRPQRADMGNHPRVAGGRYPHSGARGHYKRDPRSATLWVLLIALLPLGGSLLYELFGINRYRRRAHERGAGADRRRVCPLDARSAYRAAARRRSVATFN